MIGNLLNAALNTVPKQSIVWYQFDATTVDARGRETASYKVAVTIDASVQPVARRDYEQFGLDTSKAYYTIWASADMDSVARDGAPDKFEYSGMTLQAVGVTDWLSHNGWRQVICVKI